MPDLDRGLEAERAAAVRAGVALARLAEVGEARLVVASVLDAAQVEAVAVRARDELALAKRLVGDDLAGEADRAERAGIGAERLADLLLGRGPSGSPSAVASFAVSSRSSPRIRPSTSVPSCFTTGIAFEVAAASIPRKLGERVDRRHARRLDLLGRVEPLGELGRRAESPCAISRSAA